MKAVVITITGRVQGVFFRASAKETAEQLDIKGFTRNQPDGSVYIEAEGTEENLRQFIDWCQHGPPRAQVIHVDIQEGGVKNFSTFDIKR